jgi:RNA polymerase sigma-70 factor (ECF subfamily)
LQPTDWELVQKARAGDTGAFDLLIDRHMQSLYGTAVMMISNTQDAQDIVQETLLAAFQGLSRFEGRSSFKTWTTGILMRQVALHIRSRKPRPISLSHPTGPQPADPAQANQSLRVDAKLDLAGLLSRLSDEHREVLVLRELQGFSYDEMADVLKLPRGTVESRLSRARAALKAVALGGQAAKDAAESTDRVAQTAQTDQAAQDSASTPMRGKP